MIVRCKECNVEITSSSKSQCCGCSNRMTILEDKITALDLSKVIVVQYDINKKSNKILSNEDLSFQEERKKRKVRKLDFEIK